MWKANAPASKNPAFVGLKIKDAVCDSQRDSFGERSSVDKQRPDIRIHAFLDDKTVQIFIDTSGEALFKRGYRQDTGEAPLRENLAAGSCCWPDTTAANPSKTPSAAAAPSPSKPRSSP